MQLGYYRRLEGDVGRWVALGLIEEETGSQLVKEARSHKRGYSFSTIVILLGVVSLCFAAMTFVAANWNEMAKITRVGILLASMWGAYAIAVFSERRSHPFIADAFVLLGCGIFGATIMLVGQMYHLQGKSEDAVLLWAAGSFVAALLLRASSALWLAIALFTLWLVLGYMEIIEILFGEVNYLFLLTWVMCAGLAYWLRSYFSAHLLMLSLIAWVAMALIIWTGKNETGVYIFTAYGALFVGIAVSIFSLDGQFTARRQPLIRGFEAQVIGYFVACIIGLTAIWVGAFQPEITPLKIREYQINSWIWPMAIMAAIGLIILGFGILRKTGSVYDLAFCAVWILVATVAISSIGLSIPFFSEAYAMGLSIWLIRMGSRQDIPGVTRLGYFAFALIMLLIYFRTAGTLLGASGFYLTAGVLLVVGALILPRLFRVGKRKEEIV